MDTLVPQLNDLCDAQSFHTGWYLKDLRTGESADRHGQTIVPSASTRKIAILMTAGCPVHALTAWDMREATTVDKGHGRVEVRHLVASTALND